MRLLWAYAGLVCVHSVPLGSISNSAQIQPLSSKWIRSNLKYRLLVCVCTYMCLLHVVAGFGFHRHNKTNQFLQKKMVLANLTSIVVCHSSFMYKHYNCSNPVAAYVYVWRVAPGLEEGTCLIAAEPWYKQGLEIGIICYFMDTILMTSACWANQAEYQTNTFTKTVLITGGNWVFGKLIKTNTEIASPTVSSSLGLSVFLVRFLPQPYFLSVDRALSFFSFFSPLRGNCHSGIGWWIAWRRAWLRYSISCTKLCLCVRAYVCVCECVWERHSRQNVFTTTARCKKQEWYSGIHLRVVTLHNHLHIAVVLMIVPLCQSEFRKCMHIRVYSFVRIFVCMYVSMHVCMYVFMYVCMFLCMYVCMYICIHMYIHLCICMYSYMYICIYVYMYISVCACMHVCMYVCMFALPSQYVYMYECTYL